MKNLIKTEKIDTVKVRYLLNLSSAFQNTISDSALHYAFESIKLADKANYYPLRIRGRYMAGYIMGYTGNFVKSMQLILQGKTIAQNNKDSNYISGSYFFLGHIYKRQHDYRTAINNYLLSFDSKSSSGHPEMNLGQAYLEIGKPDSAIFYFTRAAEIQTELNDKNYLPGTMAGLGWGYAKKGNVTIAKGYISTAADIMEQQPHKQITCLFISKYFAEINNTDSSIFYAKKALSVKGAAFFKPNLFDAATLLAKLYEERNADSAYKYLRMSLSLNQEMLSSEKRQQLQTLRFEDDMVQQKQALDREKIAQERKHNLQYVAIALALLMFVIFFLLYSHSIMANQRLIKFLGILFLLVVFEFLNLLLHPYVGNLTHHSPVMMLGLMVCIAALLIPLHHKLEHWLTHKLIERNTKIRLAAAKKTIEQLEGISNNI